MSQEQILMAILEEVRSLRLSVEQQTLLSAHASRSQEYAILYDRFRHLLPPTNGLGGAPDIANMWLTMRGAGGWHEHLSAEQLGLLLCRDERLTYALRDTQRDVPPGFVEEVLSRLPRLERCSVSGMRCPTHFASLLAVPTPFPALRSIDLQDTSVTDADLVHLIQAAPMLQSVNVSNCPGITFEGITAAQRRNPAVAITPATSEAKRLEDAQRARDDALLVFDSPESDAEYHRLMQLYGRHIVGFERESMLDRQLLALWMELGGTSGWRRHVRPAQLTLMLSRLTFVVESCLQGREEHHAGPRRQPATTIPVAELVGFTSQMLSRLPRLTLLTVYDGHRWPVDWSVVRDVRAPFKELRRAHIRFTPYSVADLIDFTHRAPALMSSGLCVEREYLPTASAESEVGSDCLGKVAFKNSSE